tara:strand:+ start:596 stop:805 length:210 start_codon:yes stop_codon:yes gene_type:complete
MKSFQQLREAQKMPPGQHVFDTKVKGSQMMIHKDRGKFHLYIDGEKLDDFSKLDAAKKAGEEFIKAAKG